MEFWKQNLNNYKERYIIRFLLYEKIIIKAQIGSLFSIYFF